MIPVEQIAGKRLENNMRGQPCYFFVFIGGEIKLPAPYYQDIVFKNKIVGQKTTRIITCFRLGFELKIV